VPKYLLRIAGSEFVVPDSSGIATMIRMMEDAVPVHADLAKREIELIYTDRDEAHYARMLEYLRTVTIRKIPAGVTWKRKTKAGTVEIVRVVEKKPKALPPPKAKALTHGPRPAALPDRKQLALL